MALATDDKCTPVRGEDDSWHDIIGTLLSAAALAAAMYSAQSALDLAKKEYDMAKKYYEISKWWLDYYNDHFAPLEDQAIEEALALEYVEPEYEAARGRGRANAWIAYKGKLREGMRCTSRYCTGLRNDMMIKVSKATADAVALADGLAYRNERAYVESRNDTIFNRKIETAKLGRNLVAEAPALGKTSAKIYGDEANQAWDAVGNLGTTLGYWLNKNQTYFPTTYLGTRDSLSGGYPPYYNMDASMRDTMIKADLRHDWGASLPQVAPSKWEQ